MRVKVHCPNPDCRKAFVLDAALAGKKGKCSACGTSFVIPAARGSGGAEAAKPSASKPQPAPSKKPKPPARSRPAAEEESFGAEDESAVYEDYDEAGPPPRRTARAPRKPLSTRQRWGRVRAGLLVCAVAGCVLAGGAALKMLSELLLEIGAGNMLSMVSTAETMAEELRPDRQELAGLSFDERMRRMGEVMEQARAMRETLESKLETTKSLVTAGTTVLGIAQCGLWAALIATAAGLAFCLFAPTKNGMVIWAIAALLAVAVVVGLMLPYEVLPAVTSDDPFPPSTSGPRIDRNAPQWVQDQRRAMQQRHEEAQQRLRARRAKTEPKEPEGADGAVIAYKEAREAAIESAGHLRRRPTFIGGERVEAETEDKVVALLADLLLAGALGLVGGFLAAVARTQKDRPRRDNALWIVWTAGGLAAAVVLFYVFVLVDWDYGQSLWAVYVVWLLHWVVNVALGVTLFQYVRSLFALRAIARSRE